MEPKTPPMLARSAEVVVAGGSATPRTPPPQEAAAGLPADIDAKAAVKRIRTALEEGRYRQARSLANAAAERFSDDAEVQKLWSCFDSRGKSWVVPGGPEPDRKEEFAWLRQPPDWARGKWVALLGSEVVATADSLREVTESVRSQNLSRRPLVHRID